MATLTVNPQGSGTYDGPGGFQAALGAVATGDTIDVYPGGYKMTSRPGVTADNITIQKVGRDKPVTIDCQGTSGALILDGSGNTIEGLTFENFGVSACLEFDQPTNLTVRACHFRNGSSIGVKLNGDTTVTNAPYTGTIIENCTWRNLTDDCLQQFSNVSFEARYNSFEEVNFIGTSQAYQVDGIVTHLCPTANVEIHHNRFNQMKGKACIEVKDCSGNVYDNVITNSSPNWGCIVVRANPGQDHMTVAGNRVNVFRNFVHMSPEFHGKISGIGGFGIGTELGGDCRLAHNIVINEASRETRYNTKISFDDGAHSYMYGSTCEADNNISVCLGDQAFHVCYRDDVIYLRVSNEVNADNLYAWPDKAGFTIDAPSQGVVTSGKYNLADFKAIWAGIGLPLEVNSRIQKFKTRSGSYSTESDFYPQNASEWRELVGPVIAEVTGDTNGLAWPGTGQTPGPWSGLGFP